MVFLSLLNMSMVSHISLYECTQKGDGETNKQYQIDKGWDTYREKLTHEPKMLYGIMVSVLHSCKHFKLTKTQMAIALGISTLFALSTIRNRFYELFKAMHIGLAAIFMAAFYQ